MPKARYLFTCVMLATPLFAAAPTFIEVDGKRYGAQPDEIGPIGGGKGYKRLVTTGDFIVKDLEALIDALENAKAGQVIFIPDETEIDCTTMLYIDELVLKIPAGVTIAGNRGERGSAGGLIYHDALKGRILFQVMGEGVRITGLRIRGPNTKRYLDHHRRSFAKGRGRDYYYKFPTQDGIITSHGKLEIDNCDLSGFGHAAIFLRDGDGHHIHHNVIHHCQYAGLGYGVCHDTASSLIERNRFDANRHSIAGTGRPGCSYEARHNVELGTSLSHCFDMHGGRDRQDGTQIAGTEILIHHNTFHAPETPVVIRGVPEKHCRVYNNWFPKHKDDEDAVHAEDNTHVENNHYGDK